MEKRSTRNKNFNKISRRRKKLAVENGKEMYKEL